MRHFIILIGGPSRFQSCDKQHDQTWSNYVVPPQLAAMRNSYNRAPGEKIYWTVYMSPYEFRWEDDSIITKDEKKQCDGAWLHSIRKKAAMKVQRTGAKSYLHRIQMIASNLGITYKGVRTPQDFWNYLASFPKESISRVWYFGHASKDGLMLALEHDSFCLPVAYEKDMILNSDLPKYSNLADRFDPNTNQTSRFYGCYTSDFARQWNQVFNVPTEGAHLKIDFSVVNRPSIIPFVLERIQKTPTSKGDPGWTKY
jgi:hypothetical protein